MKRFYATLVDILLMMFSTIFLSVILDYILTVYFGIKFYFGGLCGVLFYFLYFKFIPKKMNGKTIGKKIVRIEK
jgi:uncharacterized RDD family membrane protein YckC